MQNTDTVYIIDIGNSSVKVARYQNNALFHVQRFNDDQFEHLKAFLHNPTGRIAVSSVRAEDETIKILELFKESILISSNTPFPIKINYTSKSTLGIDRVCNAVYLNSRMKTEHAVSIDIGTCIKFDLVNREKGYLGGSISPGIRLRYKSLNDYTGKLPLLSNKSSLDIVGTDTNSSIQSGVINGITAEISGLMDEYRSRYSSLTFFMTGGDAKYFDLLAKNDIFADENLTLSGLYEIYKYNA